jgi:hypothetical protein
VKVPAQHLAEHAKPKRDAERRRRSCLNVFSSYRTPFRLPTLKKRRGELLLFGARQVDQNEFAARQQDRADQ